jgi:hypothetical protein
MVHNPKPLSIRLSLMPIKREIEVKMSHNR